MLNCHARYLFASCLWLAHLLISDSNALVRDNLSRQSFVRAACASVLSVPAIAKARNLPEPTGADNTRAGSLEALVQIISLQMSLSSLQLSLQSRRAEDDISIVLSSAKRLQIPGDETSFKRLFDAYSDNVSYKQRFVDQNAFLVYYSKGFDGPGRPSIESDLPVKQTLQYGTRNDAWVAWHDFLDEADYLSTHTSEGSISDLNNLLAKVVAAVDSYLELAPEEDRMQAGKLVTTR